MLCKLARYSNDQRQRRAATFLSATGTRLCCRVGGGGVGGVRALKQP